MSQQLERSLSNLNNPISSLGYAWHHEVCWDAETPLRFQLDDLRFSQRETQCLGLLILGMTVKQCGKALGLSPRTIETHFNNIKRKLNCHSRYELIKTSLLGGFPIKQFLQGLA